MILKIKRKLLTTGVSGCFAVLLASCSTMMDPPNKLSSQSSAAPLQMRLPIDQQLSAQTDLYHGVTEMLPVSAEVSYPAAVYINESEGQELVLQPFEVPGPAKKKNFGRGLGFPVAGANEPMQKSLTGEQATDQSSKAVDNNTSSNKENSSLAIASPANNQDAVVIKSSLSESDESQSLAEASNIDETTLQLGLTEQQRHCQALLKDKALESSTGVLNDNSSVVSTEDQAKTVATKLSQRGKPLTLAENDPKLQKPVDTEIECLTVLGQKQSPSQNLEETSEISTNKTAEKTVDIAAAEVDEVYGQLEQQEPYIEDKPALPRQESDGTEYQTRAQAPHLAGIPVRSSTPSVNNSTDDNVIATSVNKTTPAVAEGSGISAHLVNSSAVQEPVDNNQELVLADFEIPVSDPGDQNGNVVAPPVPLSWTGSTTTFLSTDFEDNPAENGGLLFIPPDIHAAAGPNHVVNVVNAVIKIHTKDGTEVFSDSLQDFFGALTPANATFDPKVIYDQYAQRFVVVTLERVDTGTAVGNVSRILLAVSDDSDPTGTWFTTAIDSLVNTGGTDRWTDYPGFAVDEEAVYITGNLFAFDIDSGAFGGVRLWIIDKGEVGGFYANAAASVSVFDPYAGGGSAVTTQPAHVFDTAPAGVGTYLVAHSGLGIGATDEAVQVVRVDDPLGTPTFTLSSVNVGDIDAVAAAIPSAQQSGTATLLATNDRRALNAVWRNNQLWLTATILPNSGADSGDATAHWWHLTADGSATPTLADQGNISGDDLDASNPVFTFFPSVGVNSKGEAVVGFSASSAGLFPGAYFATRAPGDAAGTFGASQTVRAGTDFYIRTFGGSNRWGDYSGLAVDPIDECFWVYNQFADTRGTPTPEDGRWVTAYAKTCACEQNITLTGDQWNLFGVACYPGLHTPATLFSSLNAAIYNASGGWVVYQRMSSAYQVVAIDEVLVAGRGYWFFNNGANVALNMEGANNEVTSIPLVNDAATYQNMVSNPYSVDVSWPDIIIEDNGTDTTFADADTGGLIDAEMHKWNGAAYQAFNGSTPGFIGTLNPFDGIWVQALADNQSIRIPIPAGGLSPAVQQQTNTSLVSLAQAPVSAISASFQIDADVVEDEEVDDTGDGSWIMRLSVESGNRVDPGNALGQLANSVDGLDVNDLEELQPFGNNFLTIIFPHEEWGTDAWGYTSDFRQITDKPQGTWRFAVMASPGTEEVTLRWEVPDNLLRKIKIVDERISSNRIRLNNGSYTFSMRDGQTRYFTVEVK